MRLLVMRTGSRRSVVRDADRDRSIFFLSDLNVGRMPGLLLLVREKYSEPKSHAKV